MERIAGLLNRFSLRIAALLVALVATSIVVMAGLGYAKLYDVTETNAAIRVDRAARAAASIFTCALPSDFAVNRDESGRPSSLSIIAGTPQSLLSFRPKYDALLAEIGITNQGAANLFRFNAATREFDRFATTFRKPDGSMPPPMSIAEGHPAWADLMAGRAHVGEVPVMGRSRLAYLTPIKATDGSVAGVLAVDVGWVDDLLAARSELQWLIFGTAIVILALVAGLGVLAMNRELRPLKALAAFANDVAAGKNRGEVPHADRTDEVGALAQGLSRVVDIQNELSFLAYTDELTGLGNRSRYLADLDRAVAESHSGAGEWTLLHIKLDKFKDTNLALGQTAGDVLLQKAAAVIREVAGPDAAVSRLAGDQFTVLLPSGDPQEMSADVCVSLLLRLSKPFSLGQADIHLTASIGVVRLPGDAASPDEAHRNADLAVRKARDEGGDRCTFFASEMYALAQGQLQMEQMLREAIRNDAIELNFQPQINPADRSLSGLEALARWTHGERGEISPSDFIPVAESSGLIVDLGRLVLEKACRQARAWLDAGFDFGKISVNVSPMQLWQPNFVDMVRNALDGHGVEGRHICLEMTENVFIDQEEGRIGTILAALKGLGVSIALDDFGSGYSSLGYLNRLPFEQLKIDRSFVMNVDKSPRKQSLLSGIVSLGHALGLQIVAEGVESTHELAIVKRIGCDAVQGYLFARPMPGSEVPQAVKAIAAAKDGITLVTAG